MTLLETAVGIGLAFLIVGVHKLHDIDSKLRRILAQISEEDSDRQDHYASKERSIRKLSEGLVVNNKSRPNKGHKDGKYKHPHIRHKYIPLLGHKNDPNEEDKTSENKIKLMSQLYSTYNAASRSRRSDEMTVFDPFTGKYHNVKVGFRGSGLGFKW